MVKTLISNVGGVSLIPGWGVKIPHAPWPKNQNIKQKQYCNKFNKDFKKMVHIKKKIVQGQECLHSTLLFDIVEILTSATRQEKETKAIQNG